MRWALLVCTALTFGATSTPELPGPHAPGRSVVTVTRLDGSTFQANVHYPAIMPGQDAPLDPSGGPYPVVSFGHGFLTDPGMYFGTFDHLASHGFLVIASRSELGLLPNHGNFANDLRRCFDFFADEHVRDGSRFFGSVMTDGYSLSGHSMGGGAAVLAAAADVRVRALIPLAPAETNPSAVAAAAAVSAPFSVLAGTQDTITPFGQHAGPIHQAARAPRQLRLMTGGSHCGFLDSSMIFCDTGSMSRADQLRNTRGLLTAFLTTHLKGDDRFWRSAWGPESFDTRVSTSFDPGFQVLLTDQLFTGPAGGRALCDVPMVNESRPEQSFQIFADDAPFPLAAPIEPTPPIPPGGFFDAVFEIDLSGALPGETGTVMVSGRDGVGVRAFTYNGILVGEACRADLTGSSDPNDPAYGLPDGVVDSADFFYFLDQFAAGNVTVADFTGSSDPADPSYGVPDGVLDSADFFFFLDLFVAGCH
ncbi:MAG: hypothetical protein KF866_09945 [Phycisphaeraceae bacterium]|nr:hypothetical protein [Phycisphaeraceae bacterium]